MSETGKILTTLAMLGSLHEQQQAPTKTLQYSGPPGMRAVGQATSAYRASSWMRGCPALTTNRVQYQGDDGRECLIPLCPEHAIAELAEQRR